MNRDLLYNKTLSEDSSFQLIRTNPKLTGNVKLTINEAGGMWLDSIPANLELSKNDYSKFPIDISQSLGANIYQFFKNGETPSEIIFDLVEKVDTTKTSKNFKDQYDFSNYFSGIKYLASNRYEERLSYFAPLYLKKSVPNYFIILKIKDPINDPINISKQNYESGQTRSEYLIDLFKDATIIKTFDLTENSVPGKFIRDYINAKNFPTSPLSVAFGKDDYTTWNGIVVSSGALGSKGELLYDEYKKSSPLKFFEEVITKGYERNGIIFPNILNLQFVFNDETSSNYDFNRYLGIYVDAIDISNLDIDLARIYAERKTWPNEPRARRPYLESEETVLFQENTNGVIVPYKNLDFNMSEFEDIFSNSESLYFNYITDKYGKFHLPKLEQPYAVDFSPSINIDLIANGTTVTGVSVEPHGYETDDLVFITSTVTGLEGSYFVTKISDTVFSYQNTTAAIVTTGSSVKDIGVGKIKLSETSIDLGRFFGPSDDIFLQDKGQISYSPGYSYSVIKINAEFSNLDKIKFYHPNGTQVDSNGKYDLFTAAINYNLVPNPGDYYAFNDYDNVIGNDVFYFNGQGLVNEIASAITSCFNSLRNRTTTAFAFNEYVFIKCNVAGEFDNIHKLEFNSPTLNYSQLEIDERTGVDLTGNTFPFKGGSKFAGNRLVIEKDQLEKVNLELENLLVCTQDSWSKIKKTSGYVDLIIESSLTSEITKIDAIREFETKAVIVLENEEIPNVKYSGDYLIRKKFRPDFGLFSLYPIKDISFDFYSSEYLNFPLIDLYQYFFIPEEIDLLIPGETYYVVNTATAKINDPATQGNSSNFIKIAGTPIALSSIANNDVVTVTLNSGTYGFSLGFSPYQTIKVEYDAQNYFYGQVNAFNPITNELDIVVDIAANQVKFTTPPVQYSTWTVFQIGVEFNPLLFISNNGASPFRVTQACSYSSEIGFPVVSYWSNLANGDSLIYPIQDQNGELLNFSGFSILKDPTKVVPGDNTNEYNFKTKFINGLTNTEYDFYKENESVDFALRSKMIPYITKWAIKNGLDSRSNPYRLNTEIVFGRNNFSPDHTDRSQNPNNFTHEWFYIESRFNYLDTEETVKQNNYYFDTPLNLTSLLNDPDYFIEYFTYTPAFGTNQYGEPLEIAPTQFRYSNVFKNAAGQYEAFFNGFKILFKDVHDSTVIGEDGKPVAKAQTSRFDGYKFSCILKPVKEQFLNKEQPPLSIKFIEHKDHKFILIVIEIALGYLEEIDDYWKVSYTLPLHVDTIVDALPAFPLPFGYPFLPPREIYYAYSGPSPFAPKLPFETIHGDYRIDFSQVDGVDISNLSYALLYSLKNKKYNARLDNFSNVKLSSQLAISITGIDGVNIVPGTPITGTIRQQKIAALSDYPSALSDEVVISTKLGIIAMQDTLGGIYYIIDQRDAGFVSLEANPINLAFEDYLTFAIDAPGGTDISLFNTTLIYPYLGVFQDLPIISGLTTIIRQYFSFFVIGGGISYFEKLLQKLSFSKFKQYVNTLNPIINYETYYLDENGVTQQQVDPKYYVELPDVSIVENESQIIVTSDIDTPSQFSFNNSLGFQYERAALNNVLELNRYKGDYEPIFTNLLYCKSSFKFNKNKINEIKLGNVKINTEIQNLMNLPNFNHIKVADTKVLDLESDESYFPVYPVVGEVAIGQAPYFLLSSNWDWGFHYKYNSKNQFFPVAGSLRVEEDESFLGKILTVPVEVELEQFQLTTLSEDQKLTDVDLTQIQMVVKEGTDSIDGYINLNATLTNFFLGDGIKQKFEQYLVDSSEYIGNYDSIEDYVRDYISLNILKLYDVFEVEFFSKRNAELFSTAKVKNNNLISFVFLNDQQRLELGYEAFKTIQINKFDKLIISFRIQKSVASGLNISPKIKIKFI